MDKSTNEVIPYAHIIFVGQNEGTITNDKGQFELTVKSDKPSYRTKISHIGYKSKIIELKDSISQVIYLTQAETILHEVVIQSDKAEDILLKAYNRIRDNYPKEPSVIRGFYREMSKSIRSDSLLYVAEGVLDILKGTYKIRHTSGLVVRVQTRNKRMPGLQAFHTRFYGGPHSPHSHDFVMNREEFIDPKSFNEYEYRIANLYDDGGNIVYEISFTPIQIRNGNYEGKMFIVDGSFAYLGAQYHLSSHGLSKANTDFNSYDYYSKKIKVMYELNQNSYHLKYITKESLGTDPGISDSIFSSTLFSTLKILTDSTYQLKKENLLGYGEVFLNISQTKDTIDWNNYRSLDNNNYEEVFNRKIDYGSTKSMLDKSYPIVKRIRMEYMFGIDRISLDNDINIHYQNGDFDRSFTVLRQKEMVPSLEANITYEIKPYLEIGWTNYSSLNHSNFEYNGLITRFNWIHILHNKLIQISPALAVGYGSLGNYITTLSNKEDFKVNGRKINADKISFNVTEKGWFVAPSITLSCRFRRTALILGGKLFHPVNTQKGLSIKEESSFFLTRKEAFEPSSSEKLSLSNPPKLNMDYNLFLGLRFSL